MSAWRRRSISRVLGLEVTEAHDLHDGFLAATEIAVVPISGAAGPSRPLPRAEGAAAIRPNSASATACPYARAAAGGAPMLFKGRDFSETDLKAVDP
jgi:uncharacterized protein with PIN domain